MDYTNQFDGQDIKRNNVLCVLSYLNVLLVIPIILQPDSPYVRFNTNQGLLLLLLEVAGSIVLSIVTAIISLIPILGAIISWILWLAFSVLILLFAIRGILSVLKGTAKELPFIGHIRILR